MKWWKLCGERDQGDEEREREKQEKKRSPGNEQARSARFLKKQRERLMDGEQNMWLPI